jgi:hypothetical protein
MRSLFGPKLVQQLFMNFKPMFNITIRILEQCFQSGKIHSTTSAHLIFYFHPKLQIY